jgi:hypothetical protein
MAETYNFAGVPTVINDDPLTPTLHWEARHIDFEKRQESKRIYSNMSTAQREATVQRIKRAIEVMHDNVEAWLPVSFSMDEVGSSLQIQYSLVVTDIENDEAEAALVTSHRLAEAGEELKNIIRELNED